MAGAENRIARNLNTDDYFFIIDIPLPQAGIPVN
jgi:hypothetical protein